MRSLYALTLALLLPIASSAQITVAPDIDAFLKAENTAAALAVLGAMPATNAALNTAIASDPAATIAALYNADGDIVTGLYNHASNSTALGGVGNIIMPDKQGLRWYKRDGTLSGYGIYPVEEHDIFGGELFLISPWRLLLGTKGPIQVGLNDPGIKYASPVLITSGYADATYTMRDSQGIGFQTSTWTGGVNTRNYIYAQAVPLDTTGTNSILRLFDQATVEGVDGGGVAANRGKVSGNMIAEIYKDGIWSPGTAPEFVTLTDAATITLTCSKYKTVQIAKVTLAGNRTLAISGALPGMRGVVYVRQDATGSRTLALPGGSIAAADFALSTLPNSYDRLAWEYDGTYFFWAIDNGLMATIDADAQSFLTRASISDNTQKYAVDALTVALKSAGLWDKLHAIYPFVGGTATAHAQNLRHATDYNGEFGGTVTHTSHATGTITGDAASGYFDTNFNFAAVSGQDSVFSYVYCRTELPTDTKYLFGATGSDNSRIGIFRSGASIWNAGVNANYVSGALTASSDFRKHIFQGRPDSANYEIGVNAVTTGEAVASLSACNRDVFILARNANGTTDNFSNANIGFAAFGQALDGTERATFRTIIDTFQATLGRANP